AAATAASTGAKPRRTYSSHGSSGAAASHGAPCCRKGSARPTRPRRCCGCSGWKCPPAGRGRRSRMRCAPLTLRPASRRASTNPDHRELRPVIRAECSAPPRAEMQVKRPGLILWRPHEQVHRGRGAEGLPDHEVVEPDLPVPDARELETGELPPQFEIDVAVPRLDLDALELRRARRPDRRGPVAEEPAPRLPGLAREVVDARPGRLGDPAQEIVPAVVPGEILEQEPLRSALLQG